MIWYFWYYRMITTVSLVTICHCTYILQCYLLYSVQCTSQVVLVVKNLPTNSGGVTDTGFIPGSGRYPGEGIGNPLQYSCLENPIPWTEEPGGLYSLGLQRVRHEWSDLACALHCAFHPHDFTCFVTGSLYLLISLTCFTHSRTSLPCGNRLLVLCIYQSVSVLLGLFISFLDST